MNQNNKWVKVIGWSLFLIATGFFCLQVGYLFLHARFQVEYIDNRLFYIINILSLILLFLAIILLLKTSKRFKLISSGLVVLFVIAHIFLLVDSNNKIKNITSISPDFKHVFSIKENVGTGEAVYYRSYYGIFGRPKETLSYKMVGEYKIEWLAKDIAAFSYQSNENTIQQFIGTYGDRKNGLSYYYVGAEIHGTWQGDNVEVVSSPKGISVSENNHATLFEWENIKQFGTLAVVLMKNNEAIWTISLNENSMVYSDASKPTTGNIRLYKATMESEPITLQYVDTKY